MYQIYDSFPCESPPLQPSKATEIKIKAHFYSKKKYVLERNYFNLSIRGITSSGNHLMKIIPILNLTISDIPNANFLIQRSTNEEVIIYRIELDASHCQKFDCKEAKLSVRTVQS